MSKPDKFDKMATLDAQRLESWYAAVHWDQCGRERWIRDKAAALRRVDRAATKRVMKEYGIYSQTWSDDHE